MVEALKPAAVRIDLQTSSFQALCSSHSLSTQEEPWFKFPFTRQVALLRLCSTLLHLLEGPFWGLPRSHPAATIIELWGTQACSTARPWQGVPICSESSCLTVPTGAEHYNVAERCYPVLSSTLGCRRSQQS